MDREKLIAALAKCPCLNLRKAARAVSEYYDELFKPLGLRCTLVSVLGAIRALEPVSVKQLADMTDLDRTTLTRNLKPLQQLGYVRIASHRGTTDAGVQILDSAYPLWQASVEHFVESMGQDRLSYLLEELTATIKLSSTRQPRPTPDNGRLAPT